MADKEIVVITNCGEEIGFGTALVFAKDEGKRFKVWATVTDERQGQTLKEEAGSLLDDTIFIRKMKMEETSIEETVKDIIERDGRIDILIVNTFNVGTFGIFDYEPFSDSHPSFELNFFGPTRLLQLVVPQMKSKKKGRILVITTPVAMAGCPFSEIYSASIGSLEHMCEPLATVCRKSNVLLSIVQSDCTSSPAVDWIMQFSRDFNLGYAEDKQIATMMKNLLEHRRGHVAQKKSTSVDELASYLRTLVDEPSPLLHYYTSDEMKKLAAEIYTHPEISLDNFA